MTNEDKKDDETMDENKLCADVKKAVSRGTNARTCTTLSSFVDSVIANSDKMGDTVSTVSQNASE